jgi:hypothetical protein
VRLVVAVVQAVNDGNVAPASASVEALMKSRRFRGFFMESRSNNLSDTSPDASRVFELALWLAAINGELMASHQSMTSISER